MVSELLLIGLSRLSPFDIPNLSAIWASASDVECFNICYDGMFCLNWIIVESIAPTRVKFAICGGSLLIEESKTT